MNKRLLTGLLWDAGLPAVAYFVCRAFGLDAWLSLAAGGLIALVRVGYVAARHRRVDGLAVLVLAVFAVLLVASLITGDPRVLLAKESILSGFLGLVLLGSCIVRRPVLFLMLRRINADDPVTLRKWDALWQSQPAFRRVFTVMSLVWGAGLLAEALIRVGLIFVLPIDVMAAVSPLLQVGTLGLLVVWSLWYRARRMRAAPTTGAEGRAGESAESSSRSGGR